MTTYITKITSFVNTADLLKTLYDTNNKCKEFPLIDRWRAKIDLHITSFICNKILRREVEGQLNDRWFLKNTKKIVGYAMPYLGKSLKLSSQAIMKTTKIVKKVVEKMVPIDPTKTLVAVDNFLKETIQAENAIHTVICIPSTLENTCSEIIEETSSKIRNKTSELAINTIKSYISPIVKSLNLDSFSESIFHNINKVINFGVGYLSRKAEKKVKEEALEKLNILQKKVNIITSHFLIDLSFNQIIYTFTSFSTRAGMVWFLKTIFENFYISFLPNSSEEEKSFFISSIENTLYLYHLGIYIIALKNWSARRTLNNSFAEITENIANQIITLSEEKSTLIQPEGILQRIFKGLYFLNNKT